MDRQQDDDDDDNFLFIFIRRPSFCTFSFNLLYVSFTASSGLVIKTLVVQAQI